MADDRQKYLSQGTNKYLGGLEYDICKWVSVSAGMQRTKYGLEDGYMTDLSFNVSSYTFGFGAGFNLTEDLQLNVAYFWTNYEDYTKNSNPYNDLPNKLAGMGVAGAPGFAGTDVFTRTNKVFGISLNYRF